MKPTYGRVSRYGLIAFASSLDQVGPFATTVADAALLLDVIAGPDPLDCDPATGARPTCPACWAQAWTGSGSGSCRLTYVDGIHAEVGARSTRGGRALAAPAPTSSRCRCPSSRYGLSAYYLIAPAEASSNLARYDGVRYGLRVDGDDVDAMNAPTRTPGSAPR